MTPTTIQESEIAGGTRFVVQNARPPAMRRAVMVAAPVVLALLALAAVGDVRIGRWGMGLVRLGFGVIVATAALFTLFGEESIEVTAGELCWRRGKNFERRAKVGAIEQVERQGNQVRVLVTGEPPIVVGAGLRQAEGSMAWLAERLQGAVARAGKKARA